MCVSSILLLVLVLAVGLALASLSFNISSEQRGDISRSYRLSFGERIADCCFSLLVFTAVGIIFACAHNESLHKELSPASSTVSMFAWAVLVVGLILLMKAKSVQTRAQVSAWLNAQGYEVLRFYSIFYGNPWANNSIGISSGQSDSQSCFKVEVLGSDGEKRTAYILWGGYFGFSAITGKIDVELAWDQNPGLQLEGTKALRHQY